MLTREQKQELYHLCQFGSVTQLRTALERADQHLEAAWSHELSDIHYVRLQLLEELDARGVKDVLAQLQQELQNKRPRLKKAAR